MKTENRKVITLGMLLGLLSAFIVVRANLAIAQKSVTIPGPIVSDELPSEKIINQWSEETFKNVKAVNVVVCLTSSGSVPDWLTEKALAQDAIEHIKSNETRITYAPGALHDLDPQVVRCTYGPFLDEPGNLNYIVQARVASLQVQGRKVPIAIISRVVYRPDHRTSISAFLATGFTTIIDLTDGAKARQSYDFHKDFWAVGGSADPQYDKP